MVATKKKKKGFFKRLFSLQQDETLKPANEAIIQPPTPAPVDPEKQKLESLILKLYDKIEANDKKISDIANTQETASKFQPVGMESSQVTAPPQPKLADTDLFTEEIKKHIQDEIEKNIKKNQSDQTDIMNKIDKKLEDKISNLMNSPSQVGLSQQGVSQDLDDELKKSLDKTLQNYGQENSANGKFSGTGRQGNFEDLKGISQNKRTDKPKKKKRAGQPLELTHKPHEIISPTSPYRHHLRSLQNSHLFIKEKEYQMALDVYGRLQSKIPNREIKEKLQENINDIQNYLENEEEEEDRLSSLVSMVMDRLPKNEDAQELSAENLGDSLARSLTEAISNLEKKHSSTDVLTDPKNPPIIEIKTGEKPIEIKADQNISETSNPKNNNNDPSSQEDDSNADKINSNNNQSSSHESGEIHKKEDQLPQETATEPQTNNQATHVDTNKVVQEIKQGFFEIQKAMFNSEKMEVHTSGGINGEKNDSIDDPSAQSNDASSDEKSNELDNKTSDANSQESSSTNPTNSDVDLDSAENTPIDANSNAATGLAPVGSPSDGNSDINTEENDAEEQQQLSSSLSPPLLGSDGANALSSPMMGGSGAGSGSMEGSEEDEDYNESEDDEDEIEAPPQEIRGVLEIQTPDEEDTPFLTLTYDFNNIPHEFALSKDHNILEYVYYKYKPMLTKAQKFIKRKQITKALNYYRVISDQYIPEEFKQMIDRNIEDITEYLQKFLVARK